MKDRLFSPRQTTATIARGLLMGGADVVPGVSGGTVALILGIYERLVTAISRVDLTLISLVRQRRWMDAARHLDLGFLMALGAGIGIGIVALGGLMNRLITDADTRGPTLAAFCGMILASTFLVGRTIPLDDSRRKVRAALCWIAGAAFAFWLTGLEQFHGAGGPAYLFLCGMIGICAMILPGISGAYLLLILGVYVELTDILKRLPHGDVGVADLASFAVFASGCAIGIITFSKFLKWLLARYHAATMAVLCGFMCGALRKIWPFQRDLMPAEEDLKHKVFENYFPELFSSEVAVSLLIIAAAFVFVLALDRFGRSHHSESDTNAA